jgi:hypothetical protein
MNCVFLSLMCMRIFAYTWRLSSSNIIHFGLGVTQSLSRQANPELTPRKSVWLSPFLTRLSVSLSLARRSRIDASQFATRCTFCHLQRSVATRLAAPSVVYKGQSLPASLHLLSTQTGMPILK